MLYIVEMFDADGIFVNRLVFTSKIERDFNYDVLKRDYGDEFTIFKSTYKKVEE